jgi:hypothetical protein
MRKFLGLIAVAGVVVMAYSLYTQSRKTNYKLNKKDLE